MLWLKRERARRQAHFHTEVAHECAYLRNAFRGDAKAQAEFRLACRRRGTFEWLVVEEAIRRLSQSTGSQRKLVASALELVGAPRRVFGAKGFCSEDVRASWDGLRPEGSSELADRDRS